MIFFLKKLKQKNGESLTETLVALLISVLALTLLASMIVVGNKITAESSEKMDSYYAGNSSLSAASDTSDAEGEVSFSVTGVPGFSLVPGEASYNVKYYVNDEFPSTPVVSYIVKE